jgi:O-antigen/teichoic acid export membrane protein
VTLPFVIGGILIAPQLLTAIFGESYAYAATALRLLMISLFFLSLHGASRNFFLATERLGVETMIVASGVIVNIVLNLILIPRYGLNGAAFATAAADGAILAVCAVVVVALGVRLMLKPLIVPLLAGAIMAFGLIAIGVTRSAVFTIPLGAVIYAASLILLTRLSRRSELAPHAAYSAPA